MSSSSSNATNRIAHDAVMGRAVNESGDLLPEVIFQLKSNKGCREKKYASIHNIAGFPSSPPAKCSIHGSDFENRNRAFWERSCEVVQNCKKLGMSFTEDEEQLVDFAERILRND